MRLVPNTLLLVLISAAGLQAWPGGAPVDHRRPRTQLAFPLSSPFPLAEAVNLPEWPWILRMTELIQTDDGSQDLLRLMPLVAARYADASYFLDYVQKWRDRIPVLPAVPDGPEAIPSSWTLLEDGQARSITITFYPPASANRITLLNISFIDKQVTQLEFLSGFTNVLPRPRPFRYPRNESALFRPFGSGLGP